MLFVYSRKKIMTKNWKKILLTYLSYFFWACNPRCHTQTLSYYWISISNKYVKQVVLINDSWISPTLLKEWGLEFYLFFKKWSEGAIFHKRERLVKYEKNEGCWGRITYVYLLIFLFINPRNITIPGIYIKVTGFNT